MDHNYIITRLKGTPYKFATVDVLRDRLNNLSEEARRNAIANLKMEVWKARNTDIQEPLLDLIYKVPFAA